jgi:hypothetical protein
MNTTLGSGQGAAGGAGLFTVIVVWVLSLRGIQIPDTVALAFASLLTMLFHYLIALKILPAVPSDPPAPQQVVAEKT